MTKERYLKYRKEEIMEVKNLYESVMTFASQGLFYRTGRIMGGRIARMCNNDMGCMLKMLMDEGWGTEIRFEGKRIYVKDSIEAFEGEKKEEPTCHMLRGALTEIYTAATGKKAYCHEVECISSGADKCVFEFDEEVL